jgi:signal transduction histidine kinase
MRRREAVAALIAGAAIVLALLAVFAVDLSNNQARSRSNLESQAHQNAVLVAGLLDSVFASASQPSPQLLAEYRMKNVDRRALQRNRGGNEYLALLSSRGRVLAASRGFTAEARANVAPGVSKVVQMIQHGLPWALGDVRPYTSARHRGVINFATRIPIRGGYRILLTGFDPRLLSGFITAELAKVPGVKGAHQYLLDGNGVVLGSTNPQRPEGYRFHTPAQIDVLTHHSGSIKGHYFDQVPLANTTWKVLLAAPEGAFFASVNGPRRWLPWLIFAAFAVVAVAALLLALRALRATVMAVDAHAKLAISNAELERRARELARSNAELEQFASIASHDLQEPLRKVRTFAARVRETEGAALSERGVDYLRRAEASAERMQQLIEDLLVFSRVAMQTRPFAPVDLGEVVGEVLEDLDDLVRRSEATVTVGDLPTIIADPPQMRQLMQNLIANALKFRRQDVPPEVEISAAVTGSVMTLTVSDNGIGFDPQYARRIFRVFERLNGRGTYPGTGIGLALCRKIAERHGGSVAAESVPGRGSRFTVTLPVDRTDATDGPPLGTSGDQAEQEEPYVAA